MFPGIFRRSPPPGGKDGICAGRILAGRTRHDPGTSHGHSESPKYRRAVARTTAGALNVSCDGLRELCGRFPGYSLQPSIFHVVTNHHFHSMNLMLTKLIELGYRRIGFFGEKDWDDKVEHGWIGGLALARWRDPQLCDIPPLLEHETKDRDLHRWLKQNRPDVVILLTPRLSHGSSASVTRFPEKWDSPVSSLPQSHNRLSGLYQNSIRIGEAAVDFLISMLHSGERGIPSTPTRVLVESEWAPGATLRGQAAPSPPPKESPIVRPGV